jgi:hypothetical protein
MKALFLSYSFSFICFFIFHKKALLVNNPFF